MAVYGDHLSLYKKKKMETSHSHCPKVAERGCCAILQEHLTFLALGAGGKKDSFQACDCTWEDQEVSRIQSC